MLVHGLNIAKKESDTGKYSDSDSKAYIKEIKEKYDIWNRENMSLIGPLVDKNESDKEILEQRVTLFNDYKDFIDQQHFAEKFDSRSNLHSTVLEEFIFYLFKDIVSSFSDHCLIGKSHSFKDIFFSASNYAEMVSKPSIKIERKDHDFVIGVSIHSMMNCNGSEEEEVVVFEIPAVAIECKTYLDKTMLEGASTSGQQLKTRNPNALYMVVAEWLKLTENVNIKKYNVDQIYILRKQKNTDREFRYLETYEKKPIYLDVVTHLFETVRQHLIADWDKGVKHGLNRGYLI